MKKSEQIYYILTELWNNEKIPSDKLAQTCHERGITASKKEYNNLLQEMAGKKLILQDGAFLKPLITKHEYETKFFSGFAQTFINGGSQDKAIYTPPSTTFTAR